MSNLLKKIKPLLTEKELSNNGYLARDPFFLTQKATGYTVIVTDIYKFNNSWGWKVEFFDGPKTNHNYPNKIMTCEKYDLLGRRRQYKAEDGRMYDKFTLEKGAK